MNPLSVRHVLVAGSGTDALLAAATLKRQLPGLAVTLLRDPAAPAADPAGESTTPAVLQHLCGVLGLKGADIHLQARPVWTLGFKCLWGARGSFYRSFEPTFGNSLAGFLTEPGYLADESGMDACSGPVALMAAGRLFPKDGANGFRPIENVTGMNFRPDALNALLFRACQALGVVQRDGRIEGFTRGPGSVVLEDGSTLTADLFIDATGREARLARLAGNTEWVSFEEVSPCLRSATILRRRGSEPIRPFTTLETLDAGWRWRTEHDESIGLGFAWHPDFISEDEACAKLVAKGGDASLAPRVEHWNCGRRREAWTGPMIALGDAGGFVEPIASLRLGHLAAQVNWLTRLLAETDGQVGEASRRTYNKIAGEAWDEIRDFHAIHYRFNTASDSPFWQRAREVSVPVFCGALVDLYQTAGPAPSLANCLPAWPGSVGIESWLAALLGLGAPFRNHPEIPAPERKAWESVCGQRRQMAKQAVPAELCLGAARRAVMPEKRVPLF